MEALSQIHAERLGFVVLVYLRFHLYLLLEPLLRHLLHRLFLAPVLRRASTLLLVVRVALILTAATATMMVIPCLITSKRHMHNKGRTSSFGTRAFTSASLAIALTEKYLVRLKCLLAASGSSSTGVAGSMTDASSIERPPPTQSGTSVWVLDSRASFHMSSNSSTLSSLRSLNFHVHVLTADGTTLYVASRGTLTISSFSVPDVAHVPRFTMNLFSVGQLTDSGYRVILDIDSCFVQDHHMHTLVGNGPRRHDSQGLREVDWLHVPSIATNITSHCISRTTN